MVVKVLGLTKLIKKFDSVGRVDMTPVIRKGTARVQARAKRLAPVNKDPNAPTRGNLRGSIRRRVEKVGKEPVGIVSTNVHYAPHQEFGTVKMKAQPFLRPALNIERVNINADAKQHIKKELAK